MSVLDFYPHMRKLRVSNSSLSLSCYRKLELHKFYQHPKGGSSFAGDVGHALHKAYQAYLMTRNDEAAILALMMNYPIQMCADPMNERSLEACFATLGMMLGSQQLQAYELVNIKCLDGIVRPAVEVPFEIEIEGFNLNDNDDCHIPVSYIGYMDCILHNRNTGAILVDDIKTTRWKLDDLGVQYDYDEQCLPYGLVVEHALGRKITSFNVEYLHVYIDILEPRVDPYQLKKEQLDIDDWVRGLYLELSNIKTQANSGWFKRNKGTCPDRFNKGKRCTYFDICKLRDHLEISKYLMGPATLAAVDKDDEFKPWVKLKLQVAA